MILHAHRDHVAALQAQRPQQMRTLVRTRVELPIGDRLAGGRDHDRRFVGVVLSVDVRVHT
jgi:hypothetical protein